MPLPPRNLNGKASRQNSCASLVHVENITRPSKMTGNYKTPKRLPKRSLRIIQYLSFFPRTLSVESLPSRHLSRNSSFKVNTT
ncbi:hypothetical protein AAC387_Pa01g3979 [Persea americana]